MELYKNITNAFGLDMKWSAVTPIGSNALRFENVILEKPVGEFPKGTHFPYVMFIVDRKTSEHTVLARIPVISPNGFLNAVRSVDLAPHLDEVGQEVLA